MLSEDFNQILNSKINWFKFENKTILFTGANGFLPAYMVETLLLLNKSVLKKNPCKVVAVVRNKQHANTRFQDYIEDDALSFIVQDVAEPLSINEKVDFIIHAASPASPKYYNVDPLGVILPNVIGTLNTLELAVQKNVEGYLYFSSGEVYGQLDAGLEMVEDQYGYLDPMTVRACYGESKRMGENLCISYGYQHKVPVKVIRPAHTYGPGMKLDDGRVFADFVKNIVNNQNIEMKSDGSAKRAFCYLSDATIAYFMVLLNGTNCNAYNVANPEQVYSVRELAEILVNLFPEKKLSVVLKTADSNYLRSPVEAPVPNIKKIQALGWMPSISVEKGFEKTIRSYML